MLMRAMESKVSVKRIFAVKDRRLKIDVSCGWYAVWSLGKRVDPV